jgi:hypothetical protein
MSHFLSIVAVAGGNDSCKNTIKLSVNITRGVIYLLRIVNKKEYALKHFKNLSVELLIRDVVDLFYYQNVVFIMMSSNKYLINILC